VKDVEIADATGLTQCGDIVGIAVEALSEILEGTSEICDLSLLGLSVAVEYRITEVDVAGR
jgi:tetrahydromethanopterin S-methyltransferase subunit H